MADDGKDAAASRERHGKSATRPLAIVGIGVCASSLRSLEALFAGLGPDLPAAYLVAVRQQDGIGVGQIVEAVSRQSPLPIKIAADGEALESGHIYVGGSNDLITLVDGDIRVRESPEPVAHRGTIDSMLISLAEHAQDHSVAVVLGGLDSDGTAGVAATKKFGGLSIAEACADQGDPASQGADSPRGIVDLLLPIDEIAKQIALYVASLHLVGEGDVPEQAEQAVTQINQIAAILRNVTGNDFHGYKRNTFFRRIQRRMQVVQVDTVDAYVARLRGDRGEVHNLFQDLLIGVTQFFRDPEEFDALAEELPRLFEGKGADDQFRVWVLGCATGEEAYSIAILLREHLATLDAPPHVQIFATDLDARALAVARAGRYSETIADHITPERLARWFVREGDTYCVDKELREMCIFSPHNLVKDAPFSRIDLLSCRNLLIYLNADLQNRVIPIFHFSLRPGGVLFLGSSENVTRHQKLFAPIDRKKRIFRRLDTATRVLPDFPLTPRASRGGDDPRAPAPVARPPGLAGQVGRRAEAVAERYAPSYAVVDEHYEVLHFSGGTGRYLEPAAGAASLNLVNLVHRDLRLDLRSALHKAAHGGERVETAHIPLSLAGRPHAINLIVEPIAGETGLTALVVLFQDAGPLLESALGNDERLVSDEHVQRLEGELRLTKERLQATIEELESTNEELKSSNEEYQSINEELQSANEELETSKEELQSVNEELQTVNGELAHRVSDLARANSDLKNLLESTQIATLFLDNDLRLRNFTPAATEIFHLVDTDIGRPIDHLAPRVVYPELKGDVRRVLKALAPVEREVTGVEGARTYVARVLPYRSIDNFIAGAVLTFLDVTNAIQAEAALRESEARLQIALDVGHLATWDRNLKTGEEAWNDEQYRMLGYEVGAVQPGYDAWFSRIHPEDADEVEAALVEAREGRTEFNCEFRILRPDGTTCWCSKRVRYFYGADGEPVRMIGVMEDVTRQRTAVETQQMLIAELQHRTRNLLAIVRSIAQQTLRSSSSLDDFEQEFGERLAALSRVQALLSRGDGASVTLGELVRTEIEAHGAATDGRKVSISGPHLPLSSREVQVMALVLHELATNATKYGALAQPNGELSVVWELSKLDGKNLAKLEWLESHVDLEGRNTERRGFGRNLIEKALSYDLAADTAFAFTSDGIRCEICIPVRNAMEEPESVGDVRAAT